MGITDTSSGVSVVGTGWITPTGYSRAFVMDIAFTPDNHDWDATYATMLDLNDPQLSWTDQTGITLTAADAVNEAGVIVVNGYWTAHPTWQWGFVLEPQPVAED